MNHLCFDVDHFMDIKDYRSIASIDDVKRSINSMDLFLKKVETITPYNFIKCGSDIFFQYLSLLDVVVDLSPIGIIQSTCFSDLIHVCRGRYKSKYIDGFFSIQVAVGSCTGIKKIIKDDESLSKISTNLMDLCVLQEYATKEDEVSNFLYKIAEIIISNKYLLKILIKNHYLFN